MQIGSVYSNRHHNSTLRFQLARSSRAAQAPRTREDGSGAQSAGGGVRSAGGTDFGALRTPSGPSHSASCAWASRPHGESGWLPRFGPQGCWLPANPNPSSIAWTPWAGLGHRSSLKVHPSGQAHMCSDDGPFTAGHTWRQGLGHGPRPPLTRSVTLGKMLTFLETHLPYL